MPTSLLTSSYWNWWFYRLCLARTILAAPGPVAAHHVTVAVTRAATALAALTLPAAAAAAAPVAVTRFAAAAATAVS